MIVTRLDLRLPAIAFVAVACSIPVTPPTKSVIDMRLAYGTYALNVLNTFDGTFTKDLVADGSITVPFTVVDSDLALIGAKMIEIGFFEYPDTFIEPPADTARYVTPHPEYIFDVRTDSAVKHLYWSDCHGSQDTNAVKLRKLIRLIEDIVASNPEYSRLPPARGGYN